MKSSTASVASWVPLLTSVVLISHAPLNDSYREALLFRQLTKERAEKFSEQKTNQVSLAAVNAANDEAQIVTALDALSQFREEGIPISSIAEMMGVERKTVYSWFGGASIKWANEERIISIYNLLNEGKSASYRNLYRYIRRDIDGYTLATVLAQNPIDKNAARYLLERLWPLAQRTEQALVASTAKMRAGNPVIDDSIEVFSS